jgi:PKD repeat protein
MAISRHRLALAATVCVAGFLATGCGSGNPAAPSSGPSTTKGVALTITGLSAALNPGDLVALTAKVTLADGTQKLAADATWQSADSTIVVVSPKGVVSAVGPGATEVAATAAGVSSTIHIVVAKPLAKLTMTIDGHNSTAALSAITRVQFDFSGSTGGGLKYSLSFGDGNDAQTAVADHVYTSPGTFTVTARVTDAIGQVDTTARALMVTSVPEINHPYGWRNDTFNPVLGQPEFRYLSFTSQAGRNVIGTYQSSTGSQLGNRPFTGTVTDGNDVALTLTDGTIQMAGYLQVTGRPGSGPAGGSTITLTMHGGSADGLLLVFKPYDAY